MNSARLDSMSVCLLFTFMPHAELPADGINRWLHQVLGSAAEPCAQHGFEVRARLCIQQGHRRWRSQQAKPVPAAKGGCRPRRAPLSTKQARKSPTMQPLPAPGQPEMRRLEAMSGLRVPAFPLIHLMYRPLPVFISLQSSGIFSMAGTLDHMGVPVLMVAYLSEPCVRLYELPSFTSRGVLTPVSSGVDRG